MADLVSSADLADFPGAPFPDTVVEAAAESVRDAAGWHIAPSRTETARIATEGRTLTLPSLYVTAVSAIRDVTDAANVVDVTDFEWDTNGVIRLGYAVVWGWSWRCRRTFEVDFTHGYDICPAPLLPVIAARAQQNPVTQVGQVRFATADTITALSRYRIPSQP